MVSSYWDKRAIGRYAPRVKAEVLPVDPPEQAPLAYMLNADGSLRPVAMKSGFGAGGPGNFSFSITSPYSDVPINSYPAGYAYASIVSVWASRCIEIRSETVSRIKRNVVSRKTKKPIPNHPLTVAIHRAQQHGENIYALWEHCKLVFGEVFLWPAQNQYGYYSDLAWLNNLGMNVLTIGGKIGGYSYAPVSGGRIRQYQPHQLAFYKTLNLFNNLRGLSPLDSILLELGIDKDVSRVTKAWYDNDARPGVMLIPETDMLTESAKEFMDYWKANFQGAKNAGRPVMMPSAIKEVVPMQERPHVDDIEVRESMRREICARFGVPLSIAGAWDDATYQSAPEQRKSLYEETIIPECEDLDKWFTVTVLPYFDDSGETEVVSDFTDVKALIEDEGVKGSISNQRFLAGGTSFNEYRRELGKPPVPDDFFVRPQGYSIVAYDDVGKPTPPAPTAPADNPFGQNTTPGLSVPKPAAPAPSAPKPQAPGVSAPAPSTGGGQKSSETPLTELQAWRKKAMNGGAAKALAFVCYVIPKPIESHVRGHIKPSMDKTALKVVFDEAEAALKKKTLDGQITATPEETAAYWDDFDKLYAQLGQDWLTDYMQKALDILRPKLRGSITPDEILHILSGLHGDLVKQWIGTEDKPGVITKLALAGMAAGNTALETGKPVDNPVKAAGGLTVDWSLLNQQAYEFAKGYVYDLIRGLDDTTRMEVQRAISDWIATGDPISQLEGKLETIFNDASRAATIAQTESTRVYNEGAKQRWQQVGVQRAKWQTVSDSLVCPICMELHNQEFDLKQGAWSEELQQYVQAPAHVNCRCFARPIIEDLAPEQIPNEVKRENETLTTEGYMPLDTGIPGKTVAELTKFLNASDGPLARMMKSNELGMTDLDWGTDEYTINKPRVKELAKQFVSESQNIQYGKDYLMSLVQQDMAERGVEINQDTAEQVYNDFYATRAEAIYTASQIGEVKLTEAQERRLKQAMTSSYLDMVYTTESSLAGSLANQTKRKVSYGGNFYASDAARREARREFLDRMGFLDEGG